MPPKDHRVARFLANVDEAADVFDTASLSAGLSLEESGRMLSALCRSAAKILAARPDRDEVLGYQAPRSPESEALWRSLMSQARRSGWSWTTRST